MLYNRSNQTKQNKLNEAGLRGRKMAPKFKLTRVQHQRPPALSQMFLTQSSLRTFTRICRRRSPNSSTGLLVQSDLHGILIPTTWIPFQKGGHQVKVFRQDPPHKHTNTSLFSNILLYVFIILISILFMIIKVCLDTFTCCLSV